MTVRKAQLSLIRWAANLHLLFTELPLLERPAAAKEAGFNDVECWWPFDGQPRPSLDEINNFVETIVSAKVQLIAMNLYGGNAAAGDRGVASHPKHTEDFRASVDIAMIIGARLGTRLFNVPYGRRLPSVQTEVQDFTATENLSYAAHAAEAIGGTILVESLSGFPDYPLRTSQDALEVIRRVRGQTGQSAIGYLMDQYHLASNEEDPLGDLEFVLPDLRHVQIADVPNRGAPGSGTGDVRGFVESLVSSGYSGAIALEYIPRGSTHESLVGWRKAFGIDKWTARQIR